MYSHDKHKVKAATIT